MNALPQNIEPMIDMKEAARILGVSKRTVENRLREIPHMRIGTRVLFLASILDAWRREQIRISLQPCVVVSDRKETRH